MYLEFAIERVRRRLVLVGGERGWTALAALERLSPQELAVLVEREAAVTG